MFASMFKYKLSLAKSVGINIADNTLSRNISYEDMEPKFNIHSYNRIDIYNFVGADESGYYDTSDSIEVTPTNKSYNLLDVNGHCKKIFVDKYALDNPQKKEVIENTIRVVLTNLNMAAETSFVKILKDGTLLVTSDDWSDEHN